MNRAHLERAVIPTSTGYVQESRRNSILPNMVPFFGRSLPVYGGNNSKPQVPVIDNVINQNQLLRQSHRSTYRADDTDVRNMVVPLALQFTYNQHNGQFSREFERSQEYTRQDIYKSIPPKDMELNGARNYSDQYIDGVKKYFN